MVKRFFPILVIVAACWVVFVVNNLMMGGALTAHGIIPRDPHRLSGILWAPFLHVNLDHIVGNTLPLLILGAILSTGSRRQFAVVTIVGILITGGITWLLARDACHVGASSLIFCYFGYTASRALFERTFGTLVLSALCLGLYGGIVRGVLPTTAAISWEGHAAGLFTGILLAKLAGNFRKQSNTD